MNRMSAKDYLRSSVPGPKKPKYRNMKQNVEGVVFDSKGELAHWVLLCNREARGEISELKRQVKHELVPPVRLPGERAARAVTLVVDYQYRTSDGSLRLEDYKGMETPISRMKRRLIKHVKGLDVHVVGGRR